MQLQAVIVPPSSVLDDAFTAAQTIHLKPGAPDVGVERGSVLQRLRKRQVDPEPTVTPLTLVGSGTAFVRLGRFGNVTIADSLHLAQALMAAAATWPSPVVHVNELDIELTDTKLFVKAKLGGETDGLRSIFGQFHEAAKRERFFLDRRSFRPEFDLASLDLPDDPTFLERLEWDADDHQGPEWRATHISLLKVLFGDDGQSYEEIAQVPLGAPS